MTAWAQRIAAIALGAALVVALAAAPPFGRARAAEGPAPVMVETRSDDMAATLEIITRAPLDEVSRPRPGELLLRFARPIDGAALEAVPQKLVGWITGVSYGYDTVLVTSDTTAFSVEVQTTAHGVTLRVSPKALAASEAVRDPKAADYQDALQMELLHAIYLARVNRHREAANRLVILAKANPDNPDIIAALADVERQRGRWRSALDGYELALSLRPTDESLAAGRKDLRDQHRPQVDVQFSYADAQGGEQRQEARYSGFDYVADRLAVGVVYRVAHSKVADLRRNDGRIADLSGIRDSLELFGRYDRPQGDGVKLSLFASEAGAGLGAEYTFLGVDPLVRIRATVAEPNWDFAEGFAQGGTRDQLSTSYETSIDQRAPLGVEVFARRYNLDGDDGLAYSAGGTLAIAYPLVDRFPQIEVGYVLDAEYELDRTERLDSQGDRYAPMPLTNRELHLGQVTVRDQWGDWLRARATVGYGKDRYGGAGPSGSSEVIADLTDDLQLRAGLAYGVNLTDTDQGVLQATIGLTWRYAESRHDGLRHWIAR